MEKAELTRRQHDVYAFITDYKKDNGRTPTIREIAFGLGLNSHSSVGLHLKKLREKGWLNPGV